MSCKAGLELIDMRRGPNRTILPAEDIHSELHGKALASKCNYFGSTYHTDGEVYRNQGVCLRRQGGRQCTSPSKRPTMALDILPEGGVRSGKMIGIEAVKSISPYSSEISITCFSDLHTRARSRELEIRCSLWSVRW